MGTNKINKFDVDESIFHKDNKPTASDVGVIPVYVSLDYIGMTTKNTIEEIVEAMPDYSELYADIYDDDSTSFPLTAGTLHCVKLSNWRTFVEFFHYGASQSWLGIYENGNFSGWIENTNPSGYLPLTGGHLNGNLTVPTYLGFHNCEVADYGVGEFQIRIKDRTNNANIRYISMDDMTLMSNMSDALKLVDFKDGYYTSCKIFGQHNKPSGTYTGNGSTTQRIIDTGGIGSTIMIYRNSSQSFAIISRGGGIAKVGSDAPISLGKENGAYFEGGQLVITSNSSAINADGGTYIYQVL